ncbi:FGGY-family carbohydrate kinase [Humibacillus sp. DSM 29435]|uniref:FGGY-family carbohydrate kinase n=1 Tax=Humibacillus sp. DSM 29435 TaxID=1869167 RepID=UPI000ABF4560|nr:FGGY-family carbohydrate kinase [Humibacillus sp. DSM 29435]
MNEYVVGIDMGTGSTKGVLTTLDGDIVHTASRRHGMNLPRPGWAEVDAESVWWDDFVSVCRELVEAAGATPVRGLCVSGVGPCFLPTDADLRPTRPAILYGIDGRATSEIAELNDRLGEDEILRVGGTPLSSQAVGPKALWVRRREPEVWARSSYWFNSNSFVVARLTGEYVLDHHTASQCDPLYDMGAQAWHEQWCTDILGDIAMPRLAWPHEVVGVVHGSASELTGLAVGTPVSVGTIDAWAEAFSAGVREPGELMLMYGSTMFFVQVVDELRSDPMLWSTIGVQPGTFTMAAGMSTSGSLTSWVQGLTGDAPFDQLVSEASGVPAGSNGLLLLPYFAGERTPIFDPRARGMVLGLTLTHTRADLFRAVYEGIAFGIRQIVEFLDHPEAPVTKLFAVGGGTQGGLWTQIVSDVTGREQVIPAQTIGASFGDALLAAIGTGLVDPSTNWASAGEVTEPNPATRDLYDGLYEQYCSLYPATKDQMHHLALLQESASDQT